MSNVDQGDIFETRVLADFAYLQFIKRHEYFGPVARVFTTLHAEAPTSMERICAGPSFRVFYPVSEALRPPALVKFVGNVGLHDIDRGLTMLVSGGTNGPWQIYEDGKPIRDVKLLTEAEAKSPRLFRSVSHSWLLHYILKQNGVNIPVSALEVGAGTDIAVDEAMFFLSFDSKGDALAAAADLGTNDMYKNMRAQLEKETSSWNLTLIGKMPKPDQSTLASVESLAVKFNGVFDGFEIPIPRGGDH